MAGSARDGLDMTSAMSVYVDGGHVFRSVETGGDASCGITEAGALWCWGYNDLVGVGPEGDPLVPAEVSPGATWRAVSVGLYQTCAIRGDGALLCWGNNIFGERGDGGGGTDRPVRVLAPEGA